MVADTDSSVFTSVTAIGHCTGMLTFTIPVAALTNISDVFFLQLLIFSGGIAFLGKIPLAIIFVEFPISANIQIPIRI